MEDPPPKREGVAGLGAADAPPKRPPPLATGGLDEAGAPKREVAPLAGGGAAGVVDL